MDFILASNSDLHFILFDNNYEAVHIINKGIRETLKVLLVSIHANNIIACVYEKLSKFSSRTSNHSAVTL